MTLLNLVKQLLNIEVSDDTQDEYLNALINYAKKFFSNLTGIYLEDTPITQIFTKQYGVGIFKFFKAPITSINSVIVDDSVQDVSNFTISDQYIMASSDIYGEKVVFNINVGYTEPPEDIAFVVASICEFLYRQDSKSNYLAGEKAITPVNNMLPGYIREMLQGYSL